MSTQPRTARGWRLDTRFTLAFVMTLLLQSAAVVWWAAAKDYHVQHHGQRLDQLEQERGETAQEMLSIAERLARIEERVNLQLELLRRLESRL